MEKTLVSGQNFGESMQRVHLTIHLALTVIPWRTPCFQIAACPRQSQSGLPPDGVEPSNECVMTIDWVSLGNLAEVRHVLERNLDPNASIEQINAFADEHGLECSQPVRGVIYCSAPAVSRLPLVKRKWLIRFHLKGNHLVKIDVDEGLIGP